MRATGGKPFRENRSQFSLLDREQVLAADNFIIPFLLAVTQAAPPCDLKQ
jgi:hypothetical protein